MEEQEELKSELEGTRMSIIGHLGELRQRLFIIVATLFIGTIAAFSFAPHLFEILAQPLAALTRQQLMVIGPLEMFLTYIKLSLLAALFAGFPIILLQIWHFIAPGLYAHEKRWLLPFIFLGSVFFIAGGLFAYKIVIPLGFKYLVNMVPEYIDVQYSVQIYFSLIIRLILAFGVVFELPLFMWLLGASGIVSPESLSNFRKYWLIIAVFIGAMLTPPDPITQMLMAVPLFLFFEIGLLGARFLYKARSRKTSVEEGL